MFSLPSGSAVEPELPAVVPGGSAHQAAETGLHHQDPAVDLCPVLQGPRTTT